MFSIKLADARAKLAKLIYDEIYANTAEFIKELADTNPAYTPGICRILTRHVSTEAGKKEFAKDHSDALLSSNVTPEEVAETWSTLYEQVPPVVYDKETDSLVTRPGAKPTETEQIALKTFMEHP